MSATASSGRVVVAAVGNEFRRDDGVGGVVLEQARPELSGLGVRSHGSLCSPVELLGAWDGADLAVVVDASRGEEAPGAVRTTELDAGAAERPTRGGQRRGTHGIDLVDAFRLALVGGTAPARLALVTVEGRDFTPGSGLSPEVQRAVGVAADVVVALVRDTRTGCRRAGERSCVRRGTAPEHVECLLHII